MRENAKPIAALTEGAVAFYDGNGEANANIVARFGASGIESRSDVPQRIGGDSAYIWWRDSDGNGTADTLDIVASSISLGTVDVADALVPTGCMSFNNSTLTIKPGSASDATKCTISSSEFALWAGANKVAQIAVDSEDNIGKMFINKAKILDSLAFGDFAWITRSNGNMTLKWIGA